ncbi:MAG TPA: tRNA pseudouridine(55) synthase TruB [Anaerolineae bacterium]|nr:tRNA pseudouridine(55) synthase TruB [Anaerolineae bacterium]HQK15733.1 tRNA pseudouridine(55) synthase TruB [Anaerolineae bacterium]
MNGLFIVNKPAGMTSHDVVDVVRHITGVRRVGHTGTLDPPATGVLVVLVGAATRLAQFIDNHDKAYRAVLRLGETTTTDDAAGDVVERHPVTVEPDALEAALAGFRGSIMQVPPMYSAVKIGGQKLYKLAYQGKEIARAPRPVTVYRLEMVAWTPPDVTLDIVCSAGTYIRSLAHDLGQKLGCGAHLAALTRTAAGHFTLSQSHTLEELRALAEAGCLTKALLPPQAVFVGMPAVTLTAEQERAARYGQTFPLDVTTDAAMLQAQDAAGQFIAVLIPVEAGMWRPKLVFPTEA